MLLRERRHGKFPDAGTNVAALFATEFAVAAQAVGPKRSSFSRRHFPDAGPDFLCALPLPFDFADQRHQPRVLLAIRRAGTTWRSGSARRVASKAARSSAGSLRREIWISSGLRSRAWGSANSPGFGRLDLFGIPWILSSEMSLFNGLHATPGPFLIHAAPFPPKRDKKTRPSFDPTVDRAETPWPSGNRWARRIMAIDIARVGPGIGMKLTLSSLFGKKLSTQRPFAPKPSPPRKARRLVERFEWHDAPKHGSWLDMVESELAALSTQRLDRRIPDKPELTAKSPPGCNAATSITPRPDWQFTTADARVKPARLYPQFACARAGFDHAIVIARSEATKQSSDRKAAVAALDCFGRSQ